MREETERILAELDPELLAALAAAARDFQEKRTPSGKVSTVADLWADWEPWMKANVASHRITMAHKGRLLSWWGALPWNLADAGKADDYYLHCTTWITRRGKVPSPTYVQRLLTSLHSMFQWHVRRGTIPRNPLHGFRRVDEEPYARQTFLTEEQFQLLIRDAHPLYQDMATVSIRCVGMRNAEVRMLVKEEVDLDGQVIQLNAKRTKKRRARAIPFAEDVAAILRRNMEYSRGPYVFVTPSDPQRARPVSTSTMQRWIVQARERSGLVGFGGENIVFHSLRHASATQFIQDKAPEAFIGKAGGFSPKTLLRYTKFGPEQLEILRELQRRKGPKSAPQEKQEADENKLLTRRSR